MDDEESRTVFIGNLSDQVSQGVLYELFLQAGPLQSVKLPIDRATGKMKTFAFACFRQDVSVPYAIELLNGVQLYGRRLKVQNRNLGHNQGGQRKNNEPVGVHTLDPLAKESYNKVVSHNQQNQQYNSHNQKQQYGHQNQYQNHDQYNQTQNHDQYNQTQNYSQYNQNRNYSQHNNQNYGKQYGQQNNQYQSGNGSSGKLYGQQNNQYQSGNGSSASLDPLGGPIGYQPNRHGGYSKRNQDTFDLRSRISVNNNDMQSFKTQFNKNSQNHTSDNSQRLNNLQQSSGNRDNRDNRSGQDRRYNDHGQSHSNQRYNPMERNYRKY